MSKQANPDVGPGAARNFSPMKPPTYAEAFGYILQTPRSLDMLLEFFGPEDQANALAVLAELYALGAVVFAGGKYRIPSRQNAS